MSYRTTSPDVTEACAYAWSRLAAELPEQLRYHGLFHTENVVVPAAIALARDTGLDEHDRDILIVAGWFHDIGFIFRYSDNERLAAELVGDVLPKYGFPDDDVATVQGIILATKPPQAPRTVLEQLMVDADLDALGRDDYFEIQEALREELSRVDRTIDPDTWLDVQIQFLSEHRYFTAAARRRNDAAKARHLAILYGLRDERASLTDG